MRRRGGVHQVWGVLSAEEVQAKVRATVRHVDYGAKRLAADAWEAGSTDNIGVVCVYFGKEAHRSDPARPAAPLVAARS